ncbi:MAG: hypothetical protein Q8P56_04865 [Candidatus Uhrbacteria bacterium]|nr:hypothetical protein [Candidatus Uhrbacteria bacterium]
MVDNQLFLMANLGSEVLRALSFHQDGNGGECERALLRAEDIVRRIKQCPLSVAATEELSALDGALLRVRRGEQEFLRKSSWESYFNPFALRVMRTMLRTK